MASGSHASSRKIVTIDQENPSEGVSSIQGEYMLQDGICYLNVVIYYSEELPAGSAVLCNYAFPKALFTKSNLTYLESSDSTGIPVYLRPLTGILYKSGTSRAIPAGQFVRVSGCYPYLEE